MIKLFSYSDGLGYNVCDIEFLYPGKISISWFLQVSVTDYILGLLYPSLFPYPGSSPYLIKTSIRKSAYLFKNNKNYKYKLSCLNDSWYVISPCLT